MLPLPPVVVPVAALDLVRGGRGAPAEAFGKRARRHPRDGTCQHDPVLADGGPSAARRPDRPARSRGDRGQHLPGPLTGREAPAVFGGQVAGQALVAAARTVEHRRRRAAALRALPPRVLPAAGRPEHADPLRGRPHPRRQVVHAPVASSRSSTARRSSTCRPASTCTKRASTIRSRCQPACPPPERPPRLQDPHGAVQGRARRLLRPAPPDRPPLRRRTRRTQRGRRRPVPARVAPRRRPAARRPRAARVRRHLRVRHDAARHDAAAPRRALARRGLDDGEPRPRHVVPPALPGRRVAALRPGHTDDVAADAASPTASSSPATGALAVTVVQEGLDPGTVSR